MKSFIFAGVLLAPGLAGATEYYAEFDIVGQFGFNKYEALRVEIDGDGQFMGAHGAFVKADGFASPATGTCFSTTDGGVFCNLQVDQTSANIELGKNLSGTLFVKDANGVIQDSKAISLVDIYPTTP